MLRRGTASRLTATEEFLNSTVSRRQSQLIIPYPGLFRSKFRFAAPSESVDNESMLKLPRLYAITDRELSNCTHEELVRLMIKGGARLIQLRDKEASGVEMLGVARDCLKHTRYAGARLIINDRLDVAMAVDADGLHLGQEDLPVDEARAVLGEKKIIGISTHSLKQFRAALGTSADYIAFGPIFPTRTKLNPHQPVGLELLRMAKAVSDRPIVAIGGITPDRASEVINAGADSVAVISALYPWPDKLDLMSKPDVYGGVRAFIEALK
jgi:thiamine-phosphate pyrophosphorylase